MSLLVDTFGTGVVAEDKIAAYVLKQHGMHPLACTFDNGFLTDEARHNALRALTMNLAGGVAPIPPYALAVRLLPDAKDKDIFLAAGAHGAARPAQTFCL